MVKQVSVYVDGNYRLELTTRGRVYYKTQLSFIGDLHLAIAMFVRHCENIDINMKLKRRLINEKN